jgi:hypothetical protein
MSWRRKLLAVFLVCIECLLGPREKRTRDDDRLVTGIHRLRKKPGPGMKNVPQGLMLAAARQPDIFSTACGRTKVVP